LSKPKIKKGLVVVLKLTNIFIPCLADKNKVERESIICFVKKKKSLENCETYYIISYLFYIKSVELHN